jgi:hypothetical protein
MPDSLQRNKKSDDINDSGATRDGEQFVKPFESRHGSDQTENKES